jgi:acyl carrier protein
MNTASVENRVLEVMKNHASGAITPSSTLADDCGFDSLAFTALALDLEDEFGILIQSEEAEKWNTVQDAINFISKNLSK